MKESNLKNIVVLKNLPSNIVEEAFVILKSNKTAKKLEKIERNKNSKETSTHRKSKEYILKEAEMVVSNYLSNVENTKDNNTKTKINKKYTRLKKYAYATSIIIFIETLALLIN